MYLFPVTLESDVKNIAKCDNKEFNYMFFIRILQFLVFI